jgi:Uma2 family endonuclease
MNETARRSDAPDPTIYPEEEQVPESTLHGVIAVLLQHLVARWLAARGERARVGRDQFIYWIQHHPRRAVAPDVYVLPGVDPDASPGAWKVWESGVVPSLAIEIVGRDVAKDYEIGPERYDELGVRELVIYDPDHTASPERARFQIWRRQRGALVPQRTDEDRVKSTVLGAFLREVGVDGGRRIRIGTGPRGDELFPSAEEAAASEIARLRAAEEAAATEITRLRAEIEKLRGDR